MPALYCPLIAMLTLQPDTHEPDLTGLHVLVLDDELHIRALVEKVLRRGGCQVHTACNGREGLQSLLENDYDVLVVDIRMDEMDGPTFLREAHKIWPWLGVVVMTGNADADSVQTLLDLGVEHILDKPLDFRALRCCVASEAERKRERVEASRSTSLERVQYQLGILRHATESAISADTLVEALSGLNDSLTRLFPCAAAGILAVNDEEEAMLLKLQEAVSPAFVESLQNNLRTEYEALSGRAVHPDRLRVRIDGAKPDDHGLSQPGSTLTVPVISQGELHGLLLIAAHAQTPYSREEIAFLYHAASHLSTIFAALNRMRRLAIRDGLTGLYNRRRLDEEIEIAWERSRRYGHSMAIAILDLDHFKQINDGHGHHIGDQILREFSALVRETLRTSDVAGRYGGDELVALLPDGGIEAGHAFGERLLAAVRAHPFGPAEAPLQLTASIGVAHVEVHGTLENGQQLLQRADLALYGAKRGGRNRVQVWTPDLAMQTEAASEAPSAPTPTVPAHTDVSAPHILLVEDDPRISQPIAALLKLEAYEVTACGSVDEALSTLSNSARHVDLVLTDLTMPEKSGMDLLEALRDADASTVRVVLTGMATVDNAVQCLRYGAFDLVEKPVTPGQLSMVVKRALEHARLQRENQRYRAHLEEKVEDRSAALFEALRELEGAYTFTLEALVAMLDAKEHATAQHSQRVSRISEWIARKLDLPPEEIADIATGALLHDIGKISVPDRILLKAGPLTSEERAVIRGHPEAGFNILRTSKKLEYPAQLVLSHHERFDGNGYPRGLRGEEICLGARIFNVVDSYDAMRSDRPYRQGMSRDAALGQLSEGRGAQFDPRIVDVFMGHIGEIEEIGGWPNQSEDMEVA